MGRGRNQSRRTFAHRRRTVGFVLQRFDDEQDMRCYWLGLPRKHRQRDALLNEDWRLLYRQDILDD